MGMANRAAGCIKKPHGLVFAGAHDEAFQLIQIEWLREEIESFIAGRVGELFFLASIADKYRQGEEFFGPLDKVRGNGAEVGQLCDDDHDALVPNGVKNRCAGLAIYDVKSLI